MDVNLIRNQIAYLARALRETAPESAPDPCWKEASKRKAKRPKDTLRNTECRR